MEVIENQKISWVGYTRGGFTVLNALQVVVRQLSESASDNAHLPSALEHIAHLALFGEEICLEVIQVSSFLFVGIEAVYALENISYTTVKIRV